MIDRQDDEITRVVLTLTEGDALPMVKLSDAERAAITASRKAAARGEFATDAQIQATWAKYGL
jgi:predicted transcriptional regulator